MRSAILMGSAAMVAALATPAFALPDRYEQGYSCTGRGAMCTQQQLRLDDGNRAGEKENAATSGGAIGQSGSPQAAARENSDDSFADEAGDEIDNTADEAGDEISEAADEAGDAIDNAADEAGDELDEAGDAIDDAF
jgi:hypothetical protein